MEVWFLWKWFNWNFLCHILRLNNRHKIFIIANYCIINMIKGDHWMLLNLIGSLFLDQRIIFLKFVFDKYCLRPYNLIDEKSRSRLAPRWHWFEFRFPIYLLLSTSHLVLELYTLYRLRIAWWRIEPFAWWKPRANYLLASVSNSFEFCFFGEQ